MQIDGNTFNLYNDNIKKITLSSNVLAVKKGNIASGKSLGKPKLGKWKKVPDDPNAEGDGVSYSISWNKISGASGYQVRYYEREAEYDNWYTWKETTKKCKAYIGFSSIYQFKVKVRAYRISNGKKIYGPWSKARKKTMYSL